MIYLDYFRFSFWSLPPILMSLYFIILGSFVLFQKRALASFCFFLFCFVTFIWQFSWFLLFNTIDDDLAFILVKVGYSGINFLGVFLLHFVVEQFSFKKMRIYVFFCYAAAILLLVLLWTTDLYISGVYNYFWGYYPKAGILHLGHLLLQLVMTSTVADILLFVALIKYKNDYVKYNQAKFMFIAAIFYVSAAVDYAVNWGIELYPFGFIFGLISASLIAFAIIRYKFMDIETVIHKTLLWLVLSGSIIAPLIGIIYLLFPYFQGMNRLQIGLSASGIFVVMLGYYKFVQPKIDHIFQRRKYDFHKIKEEFLSKISTMNDVTLLSNETKSVLQKTLYSKAIYIFRATNSNNYQDIDKENLSISLEKDFILWMLENNEILENYILEADSKYQSIRKSGSLLFNQTASDVLVPIIHDQKLIGLIFLGQKENLKSYTNMELKFLKDLSMQLSIALANSMMFETVQKQNEDLKALDKLKNDFLANTSHELRTPLNGILGLAEAMYDGADGKLTDAMKKHLSMIVKSAGGLKGLVNDILDLSKMQSGKLSFAKASCKVKDIIDDVKPIVEGLVVDKGIELDWQLGDEQEDVYADRDKVKQVLVNLIGNAVKFTDKGSVKISKLSY